jgi:hypothetical protein
MKKVSTTGAQRIEKCLTPPGIVREAIYRQQARSCLQKKKAPEEFRRNIQ